MTRSQQLAKRPAWRRLTKEAASKHKNPFRDIMRECRRGQPPIVCLCGSTRFWKAFQEHSLRLAKEGKIVLSIGCATASDDEHGITPAEKAVFDELHMRKIDLCDEVLILNVGGYIGESTQKELEYAIKIGRVVNYLEPSVFQAAKEPECVCETEDLLHSLEYLQDEFLKFIRAVEELPIWTQGIRQSPKGRMVLELMKCNAEILNQK